MTTGMRDLTLWWSDEMLAHGERTDVPEHPARLRAVLAALADLPKDIWREPSPAPRAALARVHTAAYLDRFYSLRGRGGRFFPGVPVDPWSVRAAELCAGCALGAVDEVLDRGARSSFALCRPPGHHAGPDYTGGFCLVNNVAVAASQALARGLDRVLIVDWDVHHGDGTQSVFEHSNQVLFYSCHRVGGFYPGTGTIHERGSGDAVGYTLNAELRVGDGDTEILWAFRERLMRYVEVFEPQLVLVSCGYDAHVDDPLGGLRVTYEGFEALTGEAVAIADRFCEGRIVFLLEGGYHPATLARCVRGTVDVLLRRGAVQT